MSHNRRPKIGIGVFVRKDNKILMEKRRGAHGEGSWGLAGGHLEFGETWEACARREVMEEAGITIKNIILGTISNDIFHEEDKHYVTLFMVADYESGDLTIREPEKIEQLEWYAWEDLPSPLFLPLENLRKTTFHPFQ